MVGKWKQFATWHAMQFWGMLWNTRRHTGIQILPACLDTFARLCGCDRPSVVLRLLYAACCMLHAAFLPQLRRKCHINYWHLWGLRRFWYDRRQCWPKFEVYFTARYCCVLASALVCVWQPHRNLCALMCVCVLYACVIRINWNLFLCVSCKTTRRPLCWLLRQLKVNLTKRDISN